MKIIQTGIFCLVICAVGWSQRQDFDDLQQIDPTTGKPAAAQPTAPPPQQAPAPQAAAPQPVTPAAAPQQTPAAPAAAPSADQTPAPSTGPTVTVAPELPKYPDVRMPGESGWSLGVQFSEPREHPTFDSGRAYVFTQSALVSMQGTPKFADGVDLKVAIGQHNALRISWFESRAAGDFTAAQDLTLFSQTYLAGTLVSTNYTLQNLKVSFEYLSWPFPVESRRFRLLSLWNIQYTSMRAVFDAPQLPLVDASGNPLIDSNGNPVSYATEGTRWFISPTFGIGAHEYITKDFRIEVNASGFAIPHHWTTWDSDATINYRIGHFEVAGGLKAFHFKTSTNSDFYMKNTLISPMVALKWYSD